MSTPYRIFGSELSPYSIKVRAYCRYKGIAHEWVVRSSDTMDEFRQHAKLPLVPLVIQPDGTAMQDSTPIIEALEALFPEPSIHPPTPEGAFLSALIEEYGDEWGNKWMFHYRWAYEPDQHSTALRIAHENLPGASEEVIENMSKALIERMVPRRSFVGSSDATREHLEGSYREMLALLEAHLGGRRFLFGARPAFADFGLAPQIYEASTDPTAGAILRETAPAVRDWSERMLDPKNEGDFEGWDALAPTLAPLLRDELGGRFLPWSDANARALAAGEAEFSVEIDGRPYSQGTQKYHAKSLKALRARYAALEDRAALDPVLGEAGCLDWLS